MVQSTLEIKPLLHHLEQINEPLLGYWANDVWNVQECPFLDKHYDWNRKLIFDKVQNHGLKNELKYYFYKGLQATRISITYAFMHYSPCLKVFTEFISRYYANLDSIIDIPKEKFLTEYRTFLVENGKSVEIVHRKKSSPWMSSTVQPSLYIRLFLQVYEFYYHFYDEREETDKDCWDVRKLEINYNNTISRYSLDFSKVPQPYRQLFKKYIKTRLVVQQSISFSTAICYLNRLSFFFTFLKEKHPEWKELNQLSRMDIEKYIEYLRHSTIKKGKYFINPDHNYVNRFLIDLKTFISYIQKFEWEEAPTKSVISLLSIEDIPKKKRAKADEIKYIPDEVWEQLVYHINQLSSGHIPIILLMEATGFRISDVLSLKIDCLINQEDGWWIIGDQRKVSYKNHKVPISEEIANVVLAQQELTEKRATSDTNPKKYLFPILKGKRMGNPISQDSIKLNLNKLANRCNIKDKDGEIYWFKNHAFRHRYGVNLINNGMNILHVQKLMAHASPEMTLVYAQIHDQTLRDEWEKARDNGAVRLDTHGEVIVTDLAQQAEENGVELEWIRHNMDSIRLDHGFCVKSPKLHCDFLEQTLEPPCIKNNCRSFHVDKTFLDYYQEQISKMEADIEVYKKSGRLRSIELIEPKLKRYKELASGLLHTGGIFGLDKTRREYVGDEREKVMQNV
ncbi:tyrosine-type recombinase/integrase [Bacillus cereus]|uniref:tyrosine-type recombinase/integrase n=1 Tax=Bacillus cereus TaxID=1396 RepID=UPI000BF699FC|nr:site-specific integrase [Bacillus cereus]PFR33290.1 recombinase XerD [Bacillus cereus]